MFVRPGFGGDAFGRVVSFDSVLDVNIRRPKEIRGSREYRSRMKSYESFEPSVKHLFGVFLEGVTLIRNRYLKGDERGRRMTRGGIEVNKAMD